MRCLLTYVPFVESPSSTIIHSPPRLCSSACSPETSVSQSSDRSISARRPTVCAGPASSAANSPSSPSASRKTRNGFPMRSAASTRFNSVAESECGASGSLNASGGSATPSPLRTARREGRGPSEARIYRGSAAAPHASDRGRRLAPCPRSSQAPWHFLNFLPLPHQHGSLRPTWCSSSTTRCSITGIISAGSSSA